ncbi:MAG TPA: hypothetical protein VEZ89_16310, partial [Rubrivivax sp.]|nr:hypothetical protein [Rubrivivax sp.]
MSPKTRSKGGAIAARPTDGPAGPFFVQPRQTVLKKLRRVSAMPQQQVALSLFWRTFFLLAILLFGGVFAWLQTFRALEFEPRAIQSAQQIASLVDLSRSALMSVDPINRVALIKSMTTPEPVKLMPREPTDAWTPYETDRFSRLIGDQLR